MKERSKLLSILMSFSKEVENQFGKTIKILRSDNAKEYFSSELNSYLSSKGILHQSTCPHTPQQNGIAERKNRHLVETAYTLLLSANVPTNHWDEVVLTVCFLINRMPSASLENQIPHSILFSKDKMYHVPPRVFGCVCFVHDVSPGRDKLSARAIKCVFLGYSHDFDSIQQQLPIPYLSSTESSSFETHNQDILQTSSSVHSQAELSPPSMSTCQSRTQEMSTPVCEDPLDSCPLSSVDPTPDPPSSSPSHDSNIGWPIALQKGIRSTRNPHPIYLTLDHPRWRQAMALEQSGTWELVSLPSGKKAIGCRWIFAIKVGPNGTVDRLKARFVAKGNTQVYDTFTPVAKITTIRLLLAMVVIRHWPLHQLDIKNAFLHGDLDEEIYTEQPPGFVAWGESGLVCKLCRSLFGLKQSPRAWFGKFSQVVQNFGMTRSEADHSVFYCHSSSGKCVYLVVYVDDIVITGNDDIKIFQLKQYLFSHFQIEDLGHLKYFLGIEVAQSKKGIVISQRKYGFDILQETSEPYSDPERYRRLVGKLIYLTITRPDISFAVGVVSQFMQASCVDHWAAVLCILIYIKKTPGQGSPIDRRSTTGFCISIGENVVFWKSKKQNTVAHSNAEVEYRAMTSATCELIWVKQLIQELKFADVQPMKLYCDNQATLHIASNPVFRERIKDIEIDCHFVREKLLAKEISTEFVNSNNKLASGKLLILDQLLQKLHYSGHRVLLFAQMTHTLDILQDFLELRKYSYERLDGSIRAEERFAAIRSFSSSSTNMGLTSEVDQNGAFVFMISTRAGGVGLNLVAADTVIFYEQDWNPQVDKQALQRAHRIGQINHVLCINLVTERTVEEVIMRRAERKLLLSVNVTSDNILKDDNNEPSEVGTGDLKSIIFGLYMFDPTKINDGNNRDMNLAEISAMADRVLAMRDEQILDKDERKFEVNPRNILKGDDVKEGGSASLTCDLGLDEASYLSWVKKFEEVSKSSCDLIMDVRSRRNLDEEKSIKLESARKKAEENKLSRWKALGYQSLNVKDAISPRDNDITSATGSVHFVYGDCTAPSNGNNLLS
ncbi:putative helicase CHR10, partial [Mucuna pruriens]